MNNYRPTMRSAPQGQQRRVMSSAQQRPSKCPDEKQFLPVMAYVPAQVFGDVYSECQALHTGTLFPVLDKPFSGKGCRK